MLFIPNLGGSIKEYSLVFLNVKQCHVCGALSQVAKDHTLYSAPPTEGHCLFLLLYSLYPGVSVHVASLRKGHHCLKSGSLQGYFLLKTPHKLFLWCYCVKMYISMNSNSVHEQECVFLKPMQRLVWLQPVTLHHFWVLKTQLLLLQIACSISGAPPPYLQKILPVATLV